MKYEIYMSRRAAKTVEVMADSPDIAIKMARELNPDFVPHECWEMIKDPENDNAEIEGQSFTIKGYCESCGFALLTGDKYYQWGGDDYTETCEICGGSDINHKASIA